MDLDLAGLRKRASLKLTENKKYFGRIKTRTPKNLDDTMMDIHDQVFKEVDCLQCANCCKTTSPLFTQKDIERISKHFRMRPANFVQQYLYTDSDGDYVLKTAPCSFLGEDNHCTIYDVRPVACQGYPHTDRKKFIQLLDLTLKNTVICPAAYEIVERLKKVYPADGK